MSDLVLCEVKNGIATVTIHRPEALNALNVDVLEGLESVFAELSRTPEVKVIILTGAGEKAFVAGADIAAMHKMSPCEATAFSQTGQRVFSAIEALDKIVIAAINGYALGGGCELAMACDIRVASANAKMGIPEAGLGVFPGFGGTQRLPRLVGLAVAKELLATARQMKAEECLQRGLVNYMVPQEELMPFCMDMAEKISKNSSTAIALGKNAMNTGVEMDIQKALQYEASLFGLCFSTEDQREGMAAFMEKRKPSFT